MSILLDEKYFKRSSLHNVRTTMLKSFLKSIKNYGSWEGSLSDALQMFNGLVEESSEIHEGFEECWKIIRDRLEKRLNFNTWFLLLKDIGAMTVEERSGKKQNVFYFPTYLTFGDESTYWMCKLNSPSYLKVDKSRAEIAVNETLNAHWEDLTDEGKKRYKKFKG